MIADIQKYLAYWGNENLSKSLRKKFRSLSEDDFYDLYQDSLIEVFPTFEKKCDFSRSEEKIFGFLYTLVKHKMVDKVTSNGWNIFNNSDEIEVLSSGIIPSEYELDNDSCVLTFSEFLLRTIKNRENVSPVKLIKRAKNVTLPKHYELHSLIKLQVWLSDEKLSSDAIISITEKITSDIKSHRHFEWREPMSVVRIKSWVGCS